MIALVDTDAYLNAAAWEQPTLEDAKERFDAYIETLVSDVFTEHWVGAIGGVDNYRLTIHPGYKQSVTREKSRKNRPEWFQDLKEYIAAMDNVVVADNCEADDYLAEWSTQLGDEAVIVTADKDLLSVPGWIYSPAVKKFFRHESMLHKVTEREAFWFTCLQLLMGDSTDDIPGVERVGPVKGIAILNQAKGDPMKQAAYVIETYQEKYEEKWKDYFLINGKLLHMRRDPEDWFTLPRFWARAESVAQSENR